MLKCPDCNVGMIWQSDFTCEDTDGCECENGIVSFHHCSECEELYTYTTNCDNLEDGLEKCG
jgi:hypothetical protein